MTGADWVFEATPFNGGPHCLDAGVIWFSRFRQVAVEAIVPMNAHSGRDLGVRAQAHLYLPAIFPDFYGKPIFGK